MKKDIASKIEEFKGKKTIDPKTVGIPEYAPEKKSGPKVVVEETVDLQYYVKEFGEQWSNAEDSIQRCADYFWQAVCLVGKKEARKAFRMRYQQFTDTDWDLLEDIGAQKVDARVFMLPWYMQGVKNMDLVKQFDFFNTRVVSLYKFASEKPVTIEFGKVNQSDWRVAWDREANRLRTSEEQLKWIHSKKREYKNRVNWHVGSRGLVVTNSCTITKKQLQEILKQL